MHLLLLLLMQSTSASRQLTCDFFPSEHSGNPTQTHAAQRPHSVQQLGPATAKSHNGKEAHTDIDISFQKIKNTRER